MDWRLFVVTFGAIFLAEMGDKTQLAAMTMAANSGKPWTIFLAASAALAAVSALGVAVGAALGAYLPTTWINRAAGCLFIAIGIFMLASKD
jgi:putative Ca2+/H+ antiporter (TMEM165/GDT1 family)